MNKKFPHSRNAGFTLIELLVVVAIIGLISSIVLASLTQAKTKANQAAFLQQIKQLQNGLELYRLDNGVYPVSGTPTMYIFSGEINCGSLNTGTLGSDPTLSKLVPNFKQLSNNLGCFYFYYIGGPGAIDNWILGGFGGTKVCGSSVPITDQDYAFYIVSPNAGVLPNSSIIKSTPGSVNGSIYGYCIFPS